MYHQKLVIVYLLLIFFSYTLKAQEPDDCLTTNIAFNPGEQVVYVVSYSWLFLWTEVGEVTFTVTMEKIDGKDLLHCKGVGNTYAFYDFFFKVRDLYETWLDPSTMKPIHFNRAINEGGYLKENEYRFDWSRNQVATRIRRKSDSNQFDTLKIDRCTNDVVSAIYAARNFNYKNINKDKIFPVTAIFDKEIYHMGFKFLGKEMKSVKGLGDINCLKFQVDLIVGDIFKGDQKLYVWVTDDLNHMPVVVESPIKIGTIKARVSYWKGMRYELKLN